MILLFALGSIWFWILIAIASIIIIYFTERDSHNWYANFWLIATCALLYFGGNAQMFKDVANYAIENPIKLIGWLVAYFAAGTLWSMLKWIFWLREIKRALEKAGSSKLMAEYYELSYNKERVTHWIIYWPFSALWTLINDPVRKLANAIADQFAGTYNSISKKILGDFYKK